MMIRQILLVSLLAIGQAESATDDQEVFCRGRFGIGATYLQIPEGALARFRDDGAIRFVYFNEDILDIELRSAALGAHTSSRLVPVETVSGVVPFTLFRIDSLSSELYAGVASFKDGRTVKITAKHGKAVRQFFAAASTEEAIEAQCFSAE